MLSKKNVIMYLGLFISLPRPTQYTRDCYIFIARSVIQFNDIKKRGNYHAQH